jgi:hypothetical protein
VRMVAPRPPPPPARPIPPPPPRPIPTSPRPVPRPCRLDLPPLRPPAMPNNSENFARMKIGKLKYEIKVFNGNVYLKNYEFSCRLYGLHSVL